MFLGKTSRLILAWLVCGSAIVCAQAPAESARLRIQGYPGEATVLRIQGRAFVDLQAFAQITGSSLSFEPGGVVLSLPGTEAATAASQDESESPGFSRPFMAAGIEALASMREWGSTLVVAIRNGFPLGNAINPYRARAGDKVGLAAAAVSTDDDRNGLELLRREFSNVQAWSDQLVNARNTMSAANLTMSEDALQEDPNFQGIVRCGQYLGQMFASGSYQDAEACR